MAINFLNRTKIVLGEHLHLGTHAAIKVLHTKLNNEQVEQFRQEARILAHLQHPHIVSVLDFDVQNMLPFLVMTFAPGGTLRQRHPKGSLVPLNTVVGYVQQVASALDYAHNQKLIHRDVKPDNNAYGFLLRPNGAYNLLASGVTNVIPYTSSSLPAFHSGYNVSNVITIIARGSTFYFYVNQQFLTSASDSSLTCGKIGFFALDWTAPGAASFSNVKVWKL
jgi:serine/threonine protein kinase